MSGKDSVPVGYETVIDMYPLDFEEFLWANGIGEAVIDSVKSCFENERLFRWDSQGNDGAAIQICYCRRAAGSGEVLP